MNLILEKKEKEHKNPNIWLANIFIILVGIFLVFYSAVKYYSLF